MAPRCSVTLVRSIRPVAPCRFQILVEMLVCPFPHTSSTPALPAVRRPSGGSRVQHIARARTIRSLIIVIGEAEINYDGLPTCDTTRGRWFAARTFNRTLLSRSVGGSSRAYVHGRTERLSRRRFRKGTRRTPCDPPTCTSFGDGVANGYRDTQSERRTTVSEILPGE